MTDEIRPSSHKLLTNIRQIIDSAQSQVRQTVNCAMVISYWNIGRLIVEEEQGGEARAEFGKKVLTELSAQLTIEFGKGFDGRNLRYMRQFFLAFPIWNALSSKFNEASIKAGKLSHLSSETSDTTSSQNLMILPQISKELSWTHYRHLIKVETPEARKWYMNEAVKENWSTRTLERQINSFCYERLLISQKKPAIKEKVTEKPQVTQAQDLLKDPYVLEFLQLKNRPEYTEQELESALIDELQSFLLELGSGFSFVSRQKHIDLDGEHFYIDLVFYNYRLKCFVLIDLKRGKLTHQDIGQMDTYIRNCEEQLRGEDDNPTLGLILCSDKSEMLAKYSMLNENEQLFASKYKLYLPSEEELQRELQRKISKIESSL